MATLIFENLTQAQANGFNGPEDTLVFSTATATASAVVVTNTPPSGFTGEFTTLSFGGKSLNFPAGELSDATISFNDQSVLKVGDGMTDSIGGTTATEIVYTFGGDDTITTGGGDDYVYGGLGADTITGGAGNEHLYGFGATTSAQDGIDTITGDAGNDYIQGNAGADVLSGGDGNDRIFGGADADVIMGDADADIVNGNKGADNIDGGAGNDVLRGGADNDMINGGADNDVLMGDLGDDTLTGGAGIDVMTGGAGADTFVFSGTDASFTTEPLPANAPADSVDLANFVDEITDFTVGTDFLSLGAYDNVVASQDGANFTTLAAAETYARGLLSGDDATATSVAAVEVGSDTYVFWGTAGDVTSALRLDGVAVADLNDDIFAASDTGTGTGM